MRSTLAAPGPSRTSWTNTSSPAEVLGRPCGLGKLPLAEGQPTEVPYLVLYPEGGSDGGAPPADASEDA
ncbi:hypothetical protein [Streptomyces rimosus]|uniref:hypothetical protein n=1 Tax=Streptomyces rimosus TaxID=1927 RepID=UPI0037B20C19